MLLNSSLMFWLKYLWKELVAGLAWSAVGSFFLIERMRYSLRWCCGLMLVIFRFTTDMYCLLISTLLAGKILSLFRVMRKEVLFDSGSVSVRDTESESGASVNVCCWTI